MSNLIRAMMMSTAAVDDPVYVDDVFSTFLYDGTGSTQSINNGIDLAGKGGLVWIKSRNITANHVLTDTERGTDKLIYSSSNNAEESGTWGVNAFNANGFTVTGGDNLNNSSVSSGTYASWSFRKAPGFFDVVTYTSQSGVTAINHSLGSVPGCIMVKNLSQGGSCQVYHRSLGAGKELELDGTDGERTNGPFPSTPTSTQFFISQSNNAVFGNVGDQFVAYIFAHDDAQFGTDENESIIKCGQFEANSGTVVNLGFEPQWLLIKRIDGSRDWFLIDNMRGMSGSADLNSQYLSPNTSNGESDNRNIFLTSTGFTVATSSAFNTDTHIYMAIRRPNKPPTAGTDVFHSYYGIPSTGTTITTGFPFDMQIAKEASSSNSHRLIARKLGLNTWHTTGNYTNSLQPANYDGTQTGNLSKTVYNTSFGIASAYANNLMIFHSFKRAPGFMDVVAYSGTVTGNSDSQTVSHNLGVTPELMLVKRTSGGADWYVYSNALTSPLTQKLRLNEIDGETTTSNAWGTSSSPTAPNANNFTVGFATETGYVSAGDFIAFLFATLPGISKVGSYSGSSGYDVNVDCGFTTGARFVMIKRKDSSGHWYVWDYARGIVSGNDPYYKMNLGVGETVSTDYIDPLTSGFTVTSSAPDELNINGGTYIFLAIA